MTPDRRRLHVRALTAAVIPSLIALGCAGTSGSSYARTPSEPVAQATWLKRGRQFSSLGDHRRAADYLSLALTAGADPREVEPLLLQAFIASGRYRRALQVGQERLLLAPNDPALGLVVASLCAALGKARLARHYLERVIARAPNTPAPHFTLARVYRDNLADPANAAISFRRYLDLAPDGNHAPEARAFLRREAP